MFPIPEAGKNDPTSLSIASSVRRDPTCPGIWGDFSTLMVPQQFAHSSLCTLDSVL